MHLQHNPSGTWTAIVQVNGHRRKVTRNTKQDARRDGIRLELDLGGTPETDPTVTDMAGEWLDTHPMSPGYRDDAARIIRQLPAAFTARRLSQVTPRVAEQLDRQLAANGLTIHRRRRAHEVLSSVWTLAIRWEQATVNPWGAVPKPAIPPRPDTTPSVDDVRRLLAAAATIPRLHLYLTVAALTGARRGELCGLQWADYHGTTLTIGRSIAYTPTAGIHVTPGKIGTRGWRTVAVPAALTDALDRHRNDQAGRAATVGLPAPVWTFSHDCGMTPWRPDYPTGEFARLRARAGLDGVRLHDLRHFSATQLLAAGTPLHVVSKRLGHRQEATTSARYGHQVPAAERAAADTIGELLAPSDCRTPL